MKTKTISVAGVEFKFDRVSNARNHEKHWQVSSVKTGRIFDCFPGKTLAEKVADMERVARIVGAARFKADTEAAPAA